MTFDGLTRDETVYLDVEAAGFDPELMELLRTEAESMATVLGCPLMVGRGPEGSAHWVIEPQEEGREASLTWDPTRRRMISRVTGRGQFMDSLQLPYRLAQAPGHTVSYVGAATAADAAEQLLDDCEHIFAYTDLLGLDWPAIRAAHLPQRPTAWEEFRQWALPLVALMRDQHTRLIETDRMARPFYTPYGAELHQGGAHLIDVPEGSAAFEAGVRPGWVVDIADPDYWFSVTGATPQQVRQLAARRALAVPGAERTSTARLGDAEATWVETKRRPAPPELVTVDRNTKGSLVVRMSHFAYETSDVFDDLCRSASPHGRMVLDLRGNGGGMAVAASDLRSRFLRERTLLGSVAHSNGRGSLGPRLERWAEPSERPRWPGLLTIVIDSQTFSAAEEFIWGLNGLPHVTVLGEGSGGGIGRPALLPVGRDLQLMVSTAVTYDRQGRPVDISGHLANGPLSVPLDAL